MPLILIIAESGLEIIPNQIQNHPSVKNNLKENNFASSLLDNALHHSAMKNLEDFNKRGRPDIVHHCLLNALGSPLNKSGYLEVYIHSYLGKLYRVDSSTRIPRNYNRFKGLMAKLLQKGRITSTHGTLFEEVRKSLVDLIKLYKKRSVIIFSKSGKLIGNYSELFRKDLNKNYIIIIGGFQRGNFSQNILDLGNSVNAISEYSLDAWVVVNKVISYYEIIQDII